MDGLDIFELLEQWINGNRKDVANELNRREHLATFAFVLALQDEDNMDDIKTLAKLLDGLKSEPTHES